MLKKNIAIFASGSGSNAEAIMSYFQKHSAIQVALILTNNPKAFVLKRAEKFQISTKVFQKEEFYNSTHIPEMLNSIAIDLVVLAGFMWLVPKNFIEIFKGKIMNIHPALLPKFGGKGMYGSNVHQAVIKAKEKRSGITIHFINEKYDDGLIIRQDFCMVEENDTPDLLAQKVHKLEHSNYPAVIQEYLESI